MSLLETQWSTCLTLLATPAGYFNCNRSLHLGAESDQIQAAVSPARDRTRAHSCSTVRTPLIAQLGRALISTTSLVKLRLRSQPLRIASRNFGSAPIIRTPTLVAPQEGKSTS